MLVFAYIILQLSQGKKELEPRLLLFDGHLFHLWYSSIQHANEKNVTIITLPAHATDLLQPLNVSVFKSLKDNLGSILFNRLMKMKISLPKSEFSTLLSSEEVWKKSFSKENIQNGFRKCGIVPCDREKYPTRRLSSNLLDRYKTWVENGKPEMSADDLDKIINEG